ncbi:MAG: hypothetical protein ACOC58_00230 [Chloroflexota bacterium]
MTEILPSVREAQALPVRFRPEALAQMKEDLRQLTGYVENVLERDVDWGKIPGVPQPFLWEPGADKIMAAFNCYPRPTVLKDEIDEGKKLITYIVMCEVLSRQTGEVVATGIGVASTREGKYGARWVKDPEDYGYDREQVQRLRKRKKGDGYEWRIPNPEWSDLVHTLLQMAYKRAKVDAVQGLPGASSALRRLFQEARGAEWGSAKAQGPSTGSARAPSEEKPDWGLFWGEMNRLGVTPDQVHETLDIRSLKDDWVAKGRTLQEARQIVLQTLGIQQKAEGNDEHQRLEEWLEVKKLMHATKTTDEQVQEYFQRNHDLTVGMKLSEASLPPPGVPLGVIKHLRERLEQYKMRLEG